MCWPADAWPWGHASTSRDPQKEPHETRNRGSAGGLDSSTIRALRGGQRDSPCCLWQIDPLPVSGLTGLVFGILPALRGTEMNVNAALKETGRGVVGSRSWASKILLAVERASVKIHTAE